MDYDEMLNRALDQTPDVTGNGDRFDVPDADITVEGSNTIYNNFSETAKYLNRDIDELFRFIQDSLATSGSLEDDSRAVFKGQFKERRIEEALETYIDGYVRCGECASPDTYLTEQNNATVIRCEACGAITPTSN